MGFSRWGTSIRLTWGSQHEMPHWPSQEGLTHLLIVLEADLADGHAAVLLEVGPGGVDDGDVVLFVAWGGQWVGCENTQSGRNTPSIELALVSWARSVSSSSGMVSQVSPSRRRK